jgi:transcriptional regulator with XRE-family HTH domain
MNAVLGKNVRQLRESRHWTQQHLADIAGIVLRTVQRVEKGEGASVETLYALSNAFDVSIDVLQTDVEPLVEKLMEQRESFLKTHDLVTVAPVTCSAHLEAIGHADGSVMECFSDEDGVRDAFAELQSNMNDMLDVWDDVDALQRREWAKNAFQQVHELNRLGLVVHAGKAKRAVRTGSGTSLRMEVVYVLAWPKGQEKEVIAVPRTAQPMTL